MRSLLSSVVVLTVFLGLSVPAKAQSMLQVIEISPETPGWFNAAGPTSITTGGFDGTINSLVPSGLGKNQHFLLADFLRSDGGAPKLSDIESITYDTKKVGESFAGTADWFIQIYTRPYTGSPGSWYGHRIQAEPYLANNYTAPLGWNSWSTNFGPNQLSWGDSSLNNFDDNLGDWNGFLNTPLLGASNETYGDQNILYFTFGTATSWANGFAGELAPIKINWTNGCQTIIHFGGFTNEQPVANAGTDQTIAALDTVQFLDGTQSFDDNLATSDLLFQWTLVSKPEGSNTTLNDATSQTPTFIPDERGDYLFQLVVTEDCGDGLSSDPVQVVYSTNNLPPTAVPASDLSLFIVGEAAIFDGSGSTDPEDDELSYDWSIVSAPSGSNAAIGNPSSALASLQFDVEGSYVLQLIVFDQFGPGIPEQIEVTATLAVDFAEIMILEASALIDAISTTELANRGHRNKLQKELVKAIKQIQTGNLDHAIKALNKALRRYDGYSVRGELDAKGKSRDWVTEETTQLELYDLTTMAIDAID